MFIDLIRRRRSIREYLTTPIPREHILRCVEAARLAPSACNVQPWKFIVVDEPALKDELCRRAFGGIYSMNRFVAGAPVVVAVVSERKNFLTAMAGMIRDTRYYLLDVGIACEHMVLQAAELGIGSCWIGWFNERAVKKLLGISRDKKVDVLISLGYFQEAEPKEKIRKTPEEITSFNIYQ